LVARVGLKEELALRPAAYLLSNPLVELPGYLGLGVLSGLVALSFRYLCSKFEEFFAGKTKVPALNFMGRVPRFFKPVIGGALCGLTGIMFPQILFFGYETLDGLIANQSYPALLLLGLLALKAVMTAVCLASGLVGGLFAPSLFLGATAGAAYQKLLTFFLQSSGLVATLIPIAGPPAYAMVGAASVLASMFRAPLTGSLLLFELTRDYDILLPLMASAGMGSLLVELVERKRKADEAVLLTLEEERRGAEGGQGEGEGGLEGGGGGGGEGYDDQAVAVEVLGTLLPEGGREGGRGGLMTGGGGGGKYCFWGGRACL
jgi:H+/Cl- antiporter ClcA